MLRGTLELRQTLTCYWFSSVCFVFGTRWPDIWPILTTLSSTQIARGRYESSLMKLQPKANRSADVIRSMTWTKESLTRGLLANNCIPQDHDPRCPSSLNANKLKAVAHLGATTNTKNLSTSCSCCKLKNTTTLWLIGPVQSLIISTFHISCHSSCLYLEGMVDLQ